MQDTTAPAANLCKFNQHDKQGGGVGELHLLCQCNGHAEQACKYEVSSVGPTADVSRPSNACPSPSRRRTRTCQQHSVPAVHARVGRNHACKASLLSTREGEEWRLCRQSWGTRPEPGLRCNKSLIGASQAHDQSYAARFRMAPDGTTAAHFARPSCPGLLSSLKAAGRHTASRAGAASGAR